MVLFADLLFGDLRRDLDGENGDLALQLVSMVLRRSSSISRLAFSRIASASAFAVEIDLLAGAFFEAMAREVIVAGLGFAVWRCVSYGLWPSRRPAWPFRRRRKGESTSRPAAARRSFDGLEKEFLEQEYLEQQIADLRNGRPTAQAPRGTENPCCSPPSDWVMICGGLQKLREQARATKIRSRPMTKP